MDIVAQNAILDNSFGSTAGPASPSSLLLHLFEGTANDPVETTGSGYAPGVVPASAWASAANGIKTTVDPVVCGTPVGAEWPAEVTHFQLRDSAGVAWTPYLPFFEPLDVTGPGPAAAVRPALFFTDIANIA